MKRKVLKNFSADILILIIFLVLIYLYFLPYLNKIESISSELSALENKIRNSKRNEIILDKIKARYEEAKEQFILAKLALPDKIEVKEVFKIIQKECKIHDVNILKLNSDPDQIVAKDFYNEVPISITLSGKYKNIAEFLSQIIEQKQVINIINLEIKPLDNNKNYLLYADLLLYSFRKRS